MGLPKPFLAFSESAAIVGVEQSIQAQINTRKKHMAGLSDLRILEDIFAAGNKLTADGRRDWTGSIFEYQAAGDSGHFYQIEVPANDQHAVRECLLSHTTAGPLILAVCDESERLMEVLFYQPKNDAVYKKIYELNWIMSNALLSDCNALDARRVKHLLPISKLYYKMKLKGVLVL